MGFVAIALTLLTGHLSAALITRFGCRITTVIGGAFCVVSLIASSFVENMMALFFTYSLRFLFGSESSCTFSSGWVVISQYFKKRQSLATGVLKAGHGGGVLFMGPTLEALISTTGSWQVNYGIDQFRYIKIQIETIYLSTRLWATCTEFVGFIPQSFVLRSIVLG